jgi:hypothetical protein
MLRFFIAFGQNFRVIKRAIKTMVLHENDARRLVDAVNRTEVGSSFGGPLFS